MQVSISGEFGQVNRKLDGVVDEIHTEGAQTRVEISQDIAKDGDLTRDALQQVFSSSGKLIGHPPFRITDIMYQKSQVSDMRLALDLMRT